MIATILDIEKPKHFDSTDHVPMKERAPMFGLIDENSWLIGDRAIISRRHETWPADTPGLISTWTASDGVYAIVEALVPPPPSRPWKAEDAPSLAHIACASAYVAVPDDHIAEVRAKCVFYIGGVFMHHTIHCSSVDEHVAIQMVREQLPDRSFEMPDVLYYAKYDNRYFLVTTAVTGERAETLWWKLDDSIKDYYAELVARSCLEIATLTSNELATGIDGSVMEGGFRSNLTRKDLPDMVANCKALGIDVEPPFYLSHGSEGPYDVIIDHENRRIGVIDWAGAEFVPREWIGMIYARSMGMLHNAPVPEGYHVNDFASRVWEALKLRGFRNDGKKWVDWKKDYWPFVPE